MKHWRFFLALSVVVLSSVWVSFRAGELVAALEVSTRHEITPHGVIERLLNPKVFAQTFSPSAYYPFAPIDINRLNVPNVSACPQTTNFYYSEIVITNLTNASHTITLQDRQGSPHFVFDATPVPANGVIQDTCLDGCKLTSGFCWTADAAGVLDGYVKGWTQ